MLGVLDGDLEGSQVTQRPGLELVEAWSGLFCGSRYTHVLFQELPVAGERGTSLQRRQELPVDGGWISSRGLQEGGGG